MLLSKHTLGNAVMNGPGGSNIKSIQRGVATINGLSTVDITISSVDTTKAICRVSTGNQGATFAKALFKSEITSATNLRLTRNTADANDVQTYWDVVEYNNVKLLQKGTVAINSGSSYATVNITSVDLAKAILFFDFSSDATDTAPDFQYIMISGGIIANNQLKFYKINTAYNFSVNWRVIEFK